MNEQDLHDEIELICDMLENKESISRWRVHNRVNRIVERLKDRGIYRPEYHDYLILLDDSAKESL